MGHGLDGKSPSHPQKDPSDQTDGPAIAVSPETELNFLPTTSNLSLFPLLHPATMMPHQTAVVQCEDVEREQSLTVDLWINHFYIFK